MSITKSQLLSTGAALRHVEKQGIAPRDIERVTIDGNDVDAVVARKALADAEQQIADAAMAKTEAEKAAQANPSVWRRAMTSIGGTISSATDYLKHNITAPTGHWLQTNVPIVKRAGDLAADAVLSDPEDVARKATVHIALRGGGALDIPVLVIDATTANVLKATSVVAGTAAIVPLVGNFIQGGTGLLCYLASGASYLLGDDDLARSLTGMGTKHVRLGLIGFVPGIGNVVSAGTAARDATRFADGVPLDRLVSKD